MNNFKDWLQRTDIVKTVVVQVAPLVSGVATDFYLSTHDLVLADGTACTPIIKSDISLTESLNLDYTSSISYGDISVANNTGAYDTWLTSTYIWANKPISVYLGELPPAGNSVDLVNFELIFSGLVSDIDSKDATTINLKLRDNLQVINTSISEALLGDYNPTNLVNYTNPYRANLIPICYGEVHNITPMLTAPALLEYRVHLDDVEQIVEVRDNGVPVAFTQVGGGSFRLVYPAKGTITCSVQGAKKTANYVTSITDLTYTNTAANTIATILLDKIPYSSIDTTSFTTLAQQPVGLYLTERANILSTCQDLAKGCGVVFGASRTGQYQLTSINPPAEKSFYVGSYEVAPYSVTFKPDGTKMYVIGAASDRVRQFTLATPWDISTATLEATSGLISTQDTTATEVQFSSDGTRMFVLGNSNDRIYQYTLSTPWQVTTASYTGISIYTGTETNPNGLAFSQDGLNLYYVGATLDTIYQFSLSTAWDISSATQVSTLSISAKEGSSTGIAFSTDGTCLYLIGVGSDSIHTYYLSTPWLVSTAKFAESVSITNSDNAPQSIAISNDGMNIYISGDTNNRIYQYSLETAWLPSSLTPPIIGESDIIYNSLQISNKIPVQAGFKIGYAKNWTVQANLTTGIPAEHKDLYNTEYLEVSASNLSVSNSYGITTEPQLEQTYLIREDDASDLANTKLDLYSTPRKVYSMRCISRWLYLEPGDPVRLKFTRFGLTYGVLGRVVTTKPNWLRNYIDIEVLV